MRDLKLLTPKAFEMHALFAMKMALAGLNYIVTSTLRTILEQEALYAQGREPLDAVNRLRKAAGMYLITAKENEQRVTWTMQSRHLAAPGTISTSTPLGLSRAFDIALVYPGTKKIYYNEKISIDEDNIPDYYEAGDAGETVGLIWGGRWKNQPDFPHFETTS